MPGLLEAATMLADSVPDRVALKVAETEETLTYGRLASAAFGLLETFDHAAGGTVSGRRVALCATSSVMQCATIVALLGSDAIYCNLNPALPDKVLIELARTIDAAVVVADAVNATRLRNLGFGGEIVPLPSSPGDLPTGSIRTERFARAAEVGAVAFTSGTTGLPKGCVHTNKAFEDAWWASMSLMGLAPMTTVTTLPTLAVTNFMSSVGMALYSGGSATVLAKWQPELALRRIAADQARYLLVVPTTLIDLIELSTPDDPRLRSLRWVWSGAAPLDDHVRAQWSQRCPAVLADGYGMVDAPGILLVNTTGRGADGSAGSPMPRVGVRVVEVGADDRWRDLPAGSVGQVAFGGPRFARIKEYFQNPDRSTKYLRGDWMLTDDLGFVDEAGCLHLRGRADDVIQSGGNSVHPSIVEAELRATRLVADAVVVAVSDPRLGARLVGGVQLADGSRVDLDELRRSVNRHVAKYEQLTCLVAVDRVERDELGKIKRKAMTEVVGGLMAGQV